MLVVRFWVDLRVLTDSVRGLRGLSRPYDGLCRATYAQSVSPRTYYLEETTFRSYSTLSSNLNPQLVPADTKPRFRLT